MAKRGGTWPKKKKGYGARKPGSALECVDADGRVLVFDTSTASVQMLLNEAARLVAEAGSLPLEVLGSEPSMLRLKRQAAVPPLIRLRDLLAGSRELRVTDGVVELSTEAPRARKRKRGEVPPPAKRSRRALALTVTF